MLPELHYHLMFGGEGLWLQRLIFALGDPQELLQVPLGDRQKLRGSTSPCCQPHLSLQRLDVTGPLMLISWAMVPAGPPGTDPVGEAFWISTG